MGNGIIWSVSGKSITEEHCSIQLSLSHEGEFGFTATLSINLGKENAGLTVNLYYYNERIGELEFICADTVTEDGMASLDFTHASDYVIEISGGEEVESGNVTEPAQPEDGDNAEEHNTVSDENSKTGQEWPYAVAYIIVFIVLVIAAIVIFVRWKKEKKE